MNADAVLLSFLFNGFWAGLLLLIDRRARQSPFTLAFALALGMTAAVAVLIAKTWLDPDQIRPWFIKQWMWRDFFEAGFIEEGMKTILFLTMAWAVKPKDPLPCFIIACFIGAGFALTENMGYILQGAYQSLSHDPESYYRTIVSVAIARSVPTHVAFTGVVGFALARARFSRRTRGWWWLVLLAFCAAVGMHGAWNALGGAFFLEKYAGIMGLLILMTWNLKTLSARLNPSFVSAWGRAWIALVPLDHLGPPASKKLETLLAALAAFVYSLLVVNLLTVK
ncbi:MAG: PrsW family glutamic-type intramembrane protease [candidate division WOR-3 bacterium]